MQIKCYNNKSDNRVMAKVITHLRDYECQIFEECSIETPRIKVTMFDNIIDCNYAYIPKFKAYYYVADKIVYDGGFVVLMLKMDVLMTYADAIKKSQCIAIRSSSKFDRFKQDEKVTTLPTCQYIFRKLNVAFEPADGDSNYLLTLGG